MPYLIGWPEVGQEHRGGLVIQKQRPAFFCFQVFPQNVIDVGQVVHWGIIYQAVAGQSCLSITNTLPRLEVLHFWNYVDYPEALMFFLSYICILLIQLCYKRLCKKYGGEGHIHYKFEMMSFCTWATCILFLINRLIGGRYYGYSQICITTHVMTT